MDVVIPIFAGLGLFFIGIRLLDDHLKQFAGRRLRGLVSRAVASHRATALSGVAAGVAMQSMNAVILVLSTLVGVGAMTTRQALPLIGWANLGSAVIVLVASINLNLWVLTLLGVTGLAYYLDLDRHVRFRPLVGAMLGIGLLFLGISLIKDGAAPLKHAEWLHESVTQYGASLALGFVLGGTVTLVTQSSSTITIVSMTVASVGLLSVPQGVSIVLGAILASGASAWLVGRRQVGSARQLVMYQVILKSLGVGTTAILLAVEAGTGAPLIMAAFRALDFSPSLTLAGMYVLIQVLSDVAAHPLRAPIERFLERQAPPTVQEVLGAPRYLNDGALVEPESALALVGCEHRRLLAELPGFLDGLRPEAPAPGAGIQEMHAAGRRLAGECDQFLTAIADRHRSRTVLEASVVLRERNELIRSLQDTLLEFHGPVGAAAAHPAGRSLVDGLIESLHLVLECLSEVPACPGKEDLDVLRGLTHDRTDLMDDLRRRWLREGTALPGGVQQSVFLATSIFERAEWLVRRYVVLLALDEPGSGDGAEPAAPAGSAPA